MSTSPVGHLIHKSLELSLHLLCLLLQISVSHGSTSCLIHENVLDLVHSSPVSPHVLALSILGIWIEFTSLLNFLSIGTPRHWRHGVKQVHLPRLHLVRRFPVRWVHHIDSVLDVELTGDSSVDLLVLGRHDLHVSVPGGRCPGRRAPLGRLPPG